MNISRVISLFVIFFRRQGHVQSSWRFAACAILGSALSTPVLAANTIVRMEISFGSAPAGNIDIELYDDLTPKTVVNFLHYAGRGDYDGVIFHRSVPGILQSGGHKNFFGQFSHISTDRPIKNEFDPSRSNARGTIAMAKQGGNPDSATSEWFFNLADNNAPYNPNKPDSQQSLDYQNGGFTVFGQVIARMDIADTIGDLPTFDGANKYPFYFPCDPDPDTNLCRKPEYFHDLPTIGYDSLSYINGDPTTYLNGSNAIYVSRIPNVISTRTDLGTTPTFTADVDMVFNPDLVGTATKDFALKLLASFSSPQNESVHFNNGIHTMTMSGVMGSGGRVVTLHDGATTRPNRYYAYGKTPDNPTDHWYDFSYDSAAGTGAEFVGDKILLHFVDGQRGDGDLTANNSITHTGAQAVVTSTTTSSSPASGGCSISTAPRGALRAGDWMLVSLFLAVVALVRRRTRCSGRVGIAHRKQLRLPSDGGLCPPYV